MSTLFRSQLLKVVYNLSRLDAMALRIALRTGNNYVINYGDDDDDDDDDDDERMNFNVA